MYKILPILLFAFLFSNENPKDERVLNYISKIEVLNNGKIEVIEEITILAQGKKIRRGIWRDFPTQYKDRHGNIIDVELIINEVLRDGNPEFHLFVNKEYERRMYLGQQESLLPPGKYTYTIKYLMNNRIGFFQAFDELYYNAIGVEWDFPIDKVKVSLKLPEGAQIIQNACYTGKKGESGQNCSIKMKGKQMKVENVIPFAPNEGLTIKVAWPKGFIAGSEQYKTDKSNNNKKQLTLNRDDIYDDSWAVIIGIDKYKYSDQLNYAVKDAEAVKEMLITKFDYPEENIRYLVDEEATLSNIKLNLGEVATSAKENDRILVFYSGHGETLIGADNSEKGYIIPFEGKQENPYATGIAMDEILTTSQISKSKHMLFLMDACYSGLMTEHVKGLSKPKEDGYLSKVAIFEVIKVQPDELATVRVKLVGCSDRR